MGVVYQGLQDRLMLIAKVDYFVSMWPCLNLVQKSVDGGQFKLTAHGHPTLAIDVCDPAQWKKPSFKVRFLRRATSVSWFVRHFLRAEGEDAVLRAARWGPAARTTTEPVLPPPCSPS